MTTNSNNASSLFSENLPTNCGNFTCPGNTIKPWLHPTRTFEPRLELRALLSDWLSYFPLRLSASRRGYVAWSYSREIWCGRRRRQPKLVIFCRFIWKCSRLFYIREVSFTRKESSTLFVKVGCSHYIVILF